MFSFRALGVFGWAALYFMITMGQKTDQKALFCPNAPSTAQDRRQDKTQLTFATYNTDFLFLKGFGALKCPGTDCKWKTLSDAKAHINQVAKNIKAINADILQLNEVEDCTVLDLLIRNLEALGDNSYRGYMIGGLDSSTGQNSALLTRVDPVVDLARSEDRTPLPVQNSTCPPGTGFSKSKGVSKHFYTTFSITGFSKSLTLIGAHLLAQPTDVKRCYEREGQAVVLSAVATKAIANGNHVIMSGDWNDFSLRSVDLNNNKPISNTLGIIERSGLFNVGQLTAQPTRFSQWWDKNQNCVFESNELSAIDHIVVSDSLKEAILNVKFRSDLYQAECGGYNSDHYPLTVTFRTSVPSNATAIIISIAVLLVTLIAIIWL